MAPSAKIITEPTAKFRLANTRRFTMGFFAVSSQAMAPSTPTKPSTKAMQIIREPNQSSSSPRSSMIWNEPRPSAISPSPI